MLLVLLLAAAGATVAIPQPKDNPKCGYDSCTDYHPGKLNVHIVAHTHDDVGWLKTVDQYYYGNRNGIQKAGVQYILDSVVKELWEDPKRTFIYVETAFFHKWWVRQPSYIQNRVLTLVQEGRLKFAGGAWSMNDEADVHYQSTIDQFTWGLKFLNDIFGDCGRPTVGWQIDPFGHSKEFASLISQMGYDALFLGRIDYQDKQNRMKKKEMEFVWNAGDEFPGVNHSIFTHVLYNTYSPPPGFCFDVLCNDEPIIDDPESPDYNVERRVAKFLKYVQDMRKVYRSNNVLVTMGGDFTYQDAGMWYSNLDKLIKYGNKIAAENNLDIVLYYSTPDCYYDAFRKATPNFDDLPTKQDDFFPYASDPHSYWTGFFTSRPTIKYIEAEANRYTQMVKQLQVLANLPEENMKVIDELKSAMGVLQHHDAITGTEKQHVTYDYIRMITKALDDAHRITSQALNKMMFGDNRTMDLTFDRCHFNESRCETSENAQGNMIVTLYNPLAWNVAVPVNIPTMGQNYEVTDGNGHIYPVQSAPISDSIKKIPSRNSKATHELTFIVQLPSIGYRSFYLTKIDRSKRDVKEIDKFEDYEIVRSLWDQVKMAYPDVSQEIDLNELLVPNLGDERFHLWGRLQRSKLSTYPGMSFEDTQMLGDDPMTMIVERYDDDGQMEEAIPSANTDKTIHLKTFNETADLSCHFGYYPGYIGNNEVYENRSSGAYIFRPDASTYNSLKILNRAESTGPVYNSQIVELSDNAALEFKTYNDSYIRYGELKWIIGPITIEDGVGKEYIVQYESDMVTNGEFYTDSNGRQVLKRRKGQRPQWNLTLEEPISGNYYPVVDLAYIKNDHGLCVRVLPDRPEGGASLEEGHLELMLHRRLLHDDAFGVGEALNETESGKGLVVSGTHRIFFDSNDLDFIDVIEMRSRPQVFVSDADHLSRPAWLAHHREHSWYNSTPSGVHLLTLEPHNKDLLLRLENYFERPIRDLDLRNIFKNIHMKSVRETVLSAHKSLDESSADELKDDSDKFKVTLNTKQIRTFIIEYEHKNA